MSKIDLQARRGERRNAAALPPSTQVEGLKELNTKQGPASGAPSAKAKKKKASSGLPVARLPEETSILVSPFGAAEAGDVPSKVAKHFRRGARQAAAALPQLAEGFAFDDKVLRLVERPNGYYALYRGGEYLKSTRTKNRKKAQAFLEVWKIQEEALEEGMVDVRQALAETVIDEYLEAIPLDEEGARRLGEDRLGRFRPFVEGKRVRDLAGKGMVAVEQEMRKIYAHSVVECCIKTFGTAIRGYGVIHSCPAVPPYAKRKQAPGRNRVLTKRELERIMLWAIETGVDAWAAHRRLMGRRLTILGIQTGSRIGRFARMAWEPDLGGGYIDVETGIMYRCPPGTPTSATKQAPPLRLPPDLLAEVRRWRAADGPDQQWVFRNFEGSPADKAYLQDVFKKMMKELKITGVVPHTLRHTAITRLIERAVPASVISAVVGISVAQLRTRYNHSDDLEVQPLAHAAMDGLITH